MVFVSQALADDYANAYPGSTVPPGRHGYRPRLRRSSPAGPGRPLPGRPGALKVGYVGHLYPGRGIEVILALADRVPEADFHVVGGTAADLAHWRKRRDRPHLHFHGHQPPGSLHPYYRAFDLVLAPYQQQVACAGGVGDISRWVSPMKLFEYMSHGQAIIASDLPVLREVLTDNVNCVLCRPTTSRPGRAVRRLAASPTCGPAWVTRPATGCSPSTPGADAPTGSCPGHRPRRPAGPAATERAVR